MPRPSERPTSGSRLPKRSTATPITMSNSSGPSCGNMQRSPQKPSQINETPIEPDALASRDAEPRSFQRGAEEPRSHSRTAAGEAPVRSGIRWCCLLVGGHGLVDIILDARDALLEFGNALSQRTHHAGQAVAEDQEGNEGDDDQLGRSEVRKECKRYHEKGPLIRAKAGAAQATEIVGMSSRSRIQAPLHHFDRSSGAGRRATVPKRRCGRWRSAFG